jgi:DNA-binding MarR family transcriptional regulator
MTVMIDQLVDDIQNLYPQIYLACHVDHVRSSSTTWRLSSRDSSILSHLSPRRATSQRDLAGHLGVAASTLSATIARLSRLGYVSSTPVPGDQRRRDLRLTPKGSEARASTAVLDSTRVRALVLGLSERDRETAARGLAILARGARHLAEGPR